MNRSDIARLIEASGMAEEFTEAGFFENQDQALRAIVEQFGTPRFAPSVPNWGRGILEESVFVSSSGAVFLAGWTTEFTVQWLEVRPGKVRKISLPDGLKVVSIDDRWVWLQRFDEYDRPTVFRIPLEEG